MSYSGRAFCPAQAAQRTADDGVTLDAAIQKLRELDWSAGEDWPMGVPDDLADQVRACETP